MTREKWKDIFEAIGAIVLVGSIIFLAIEIRQNTVEVRLGNQQSALALVHEWDSWIRDAAFSETYDNGIRDLSSLSPRELRQFDTYIGQALNIWEFAFISHESGTMSDEIWTAWDMWFQSEIRQDSWRQLWMTTKRETYSASFRSHVDAYLQID